jgi:hypothetical protein
MTSPLLDLLRTAQSGPMDPGSLDLLSALRDIHEPAPPPVWPPAPGWWIAGAALLAAAVALALWLRRRRLRQRPIRAALAELEQWQRTAGDDPVRDAEVLAALLRRAALVRYPREAVAPLAGDAFLTFLDRTAGSHAFSAGAGRVLGSDRYAPDVTLDVRPLHALARRWLREHLDGPTVEPERLPAVHADGTAESGPRERAA